MEKYTNHLPFLYFLSEVIRILRVHDSEIIHTAVEILGRHLKCGHKKIVAGGRGRKGKEKPAAMQSPRHLPKAPNCFHSLRASTVTQKPIILTFLAKQKLQKNLPLKSAR